MFYIGEILKTRGNNGEVVLRTSPDFCFNKAITSIHLKSKKHSKILNIDKINGSGNDLIIKFTDINTISDAYRLVGYSAYLEDNEEITASKKQTLIGYTVSDIEGELWGKVINDIEEGLTRTLEVDDNNAIVLIPYSEDMIKETDNSEKIIIIDPPDGLRNLNK